MMNHALIETRLDDFVEGLLSEEERHAVERHLGECDACRGEVEAVRRLQTMARALPREIQPPRDLWAGIAAGIHEEPAAGPATAEKVRVIPIEFGRRARPAWWMRRDLLAAAAIALIVISSSITALLVRGGPAAPGGPLAVQEGSVPATSALVAFQPAEQELVQTVEQLQFALEAQRDRLNPETVAVVEESLRVIEHAIGEARAALEADPNNRDLTFLLMEVYQKKVDLLQNAVQISSL
jgi:anti-sigma factor RsiW